MTGKPESWPAAAARIWGTHIGIRSIPEIGRALKPLVDLKGADQVLVWLEAYCEMAPRMDRNGAVSADTFECAFCLRFKDRAIDLAGKSIYDDPICEACYNTFGVCVTCERSMQVHHEGLPGQCRLCAPRSSNRIGTKQHPSAKAAADLDRECADRILRDNT